jgi:hypothetical protein
MTQETVLQTRFLNGLQNYNLTQDEIQNIHKWTYCGDTSFRGREKFKQLCPNTPFPPLTNECVCGHAIVQNCFITDGNQILILGSCCVKRFTITGTKQTCEKCKTPHKNRVVNRCNRCRLKYCDKCNKEGINDEWRTICKKCYWS